MLSNYHPYFYNMQMIIYIVYMYFSEIIYRVISKGLQDFLRGADTGSSARRA